MKSEYPIVWLMEELRDGKSKLGEPAFEARLLRAVEEYGAYSQENTQKCTKQLMGLLQPFCSILERPEIAGMFGTTYNVEMIKELGSRRNLTSSLNSGIEEATSQFFPTPHIIDYPNLVNPDEHFAEKWNSAIFDSILDPGNILGEDFKNLLADVNKDPKLLDSPEFNQRIQAIADGDPEIAAKLENRRQVLNNLLEGSEQVTKSSPTRLDPAAANRCGGGSRLGMATDKLYGVFSENGDWIVQSDYWRNYSRSLQRMGGDYKDAVEVNISPINPSIETEWDELKMLRIRTHGTSNDPKAFTHRIPTWVSNDVKKKLGDGWAHFLFHANLLADIDQDLYEKQRKAWTIGGGIPFVLICKDLTNYQPLVEYWLEYLAKNPNYQRYSVRTEAYFREALELIKRKQETDMEPKEHPFAEFVNYVIDPTNMWAPEKYIPARSVSMVFRGKEVKVSYQYLMGSGYLEGSIEEMCFRIFFSMNQGFQIFLFAMGTDPKEAGRPMNYPPYEAKKVIEYFDGLFQQFTTQN